MQELSLKVATKGYVEIPGNDEPRSEILSTSEHFIVTKRPGFKYSYGIGLSAYSPAEITCWRIVGNFTNSRGETVVYRVVAAISYPARKKKDREEDEHDAA